MQEQTMKCAAGCGRTKALNAFQQAAVKAGLFKSWTCDDCAAKAAKRMFTQKR